MNEPRSRCLTGNKEGMWEDSDNIFHPRFRSRGLWDDAGAILEGQFGQLGPTGLGFTGLTGAA